MGLVYQGVPTETALMLRSLFDIRCFVETGTFFGNTAVWASQYFDQVYTIEASPELWKQTSQRYEAIKNIDFILGDSGTSLKEVAHKLKGSTIFWLDAHWSSGVTYGENDECPLIQELNALQFSSVDKFIMIDDARLFLAPPPKPHRADQWPTIDEVLKALAQISTEQKVIIYDDVILCIPLQAYLPVSEFFQHKISHASQSKRTTGYQALYQHMKSVIGR